MISADSALDTASHVAMAPVDSVRGHFPALRRLHAGVPVAYFDGPGGTQTPRAVVEAMTDYLYHHNANTHWHFPSSQETDAALAGARAALADLLGAAAEEIAFGANMTTLTFHLSRALARSWKAGDEVVVTELDHHANVDPWRAIGQERGIVVRTAAMHASDGTLDWPSLEQAIGPRTRLVAIGAASNALGTITDVARAARIAHAAGALVFVDAVHYAPHALVDVRALDCDFLACSAYKFYGPHVGVLYGRRALIEELDVPRLLPSSTAVPERLETGTLNHEGIVGAAAAVDFMASLAGGGPRRQRLARFFVAQHSRGTALLRQAWEGLRAIRGVTVYGPPPEAPRTPTLSFAVRGRHSDDVAAAMAGRGLFVSSGDFYATTAVARLGHSNDGLVRAGCAIYTTSDEVERLIEAVAAIAAG